MATPAERLLQQLEAERGAQSESEAERMLRELEAQQNIDTSPFQLPVIQPPPSRYGTGGLREASPQPMKLSDELTAAAESGVDVLTGAPVGRLTAGFAQNEAMQAQALESRLSEHYGAPVRIRMGPQSGQMEFLNPETNRFTLVDEARVSLRDLPEVLGPAITAGGAVVGEFLGGPPGAAVGGAAGEVARRSIGSAMGVRDEDAASVSRGAMGAGVVEGALSGGGRLAARGAEGARNFIRPPAVTPERAASILTATESAQAVADEISRRTGQRFQPFTSQMSEDPVLQGAETRVLASPQTADEARQQLRQNQTALETFFDQINPTGAPPNSQIGRAVQQEAREQTQPRIDALSEGVQRQVRELEEMTAALPRAQNQQIGSQLRQVAQEGRTELKAIEDSAWDDVRTAIGYNPDTALSDIKIPVQGELRSTLNRLTSEAREALLSSQRAGKQALTPDEITGRSAAREAVKRARAEGVTDNDELTRIFEDTIRNHRVDLNQLNDTISELRRQDRLARRNEVATDPTGRDRSRLLGALITHRNDMLRQEAPEVLAQLEAAEALTAQRANLFDKGVVGGLLRRADGGYVITEPEVVGRTIASGNPEAVQHLVGVFSRHPAGIPTLQRSMLSFYRNEVVEDGIPRAQLHKRFMERHGDTLDVLFPDDPKIKRLGEFENVVSKNLKRFEDFEKRVDLMFRGRVQDIAPERIAEDIFSRRFSEKDVSRLMALANDAGMKEQYQRAVGDQIRRQFMSTTSGLQLKRLDDFINNRRNLPRLYSVFGDQYVRDMRTLLSGLRTANTRAGGIGTTRNPNLIGSIAEGLARTTVARPLSPGGVALTRAQRIRAQAAERVMAEMLRDPQTLRNLVSQGQRDVRNRKVAQLLAVLGGSSLAIDAGELADGR